MKFLALIFTTLFLLSTSATAFKLPFGNLGQCNWVTCFVDPCTVSHCSIPGALCHSNYCNGCHAEWYIGGHINYPKERMMNILRNWMKLTTQSKLNKLPIKQLVNSSSKKFLSSEVTSIGKEKTTLRGETFTIHNLDTSLRYLKSEAYAEAYGTHRVWELYVRNFKGNKLPLKTRQQCISGGIYRTGNPCPLCRDEYLIVHYKNVELLKQFIDDDSGKILHPNKTHVCQKQFQMLEIEIGKAKDYGFIVHEVPFREYDYADYYPPNTFDRNDMSESMKIEKGDSLPKWMSETPRKYLYDKIGRMRAELKNGK
ncbi:hypothetical protein SNEBB_006730 [Seison nebaliae]|nr:hypothetical protein SNEBB_006730 [Seison nebaliae]